MVNSNFIYVSQHSKGPKLWLRKKTWNLLVLVTFTQCAIWRLAFQSLILQSLQVHKTKLTFESFKVWCKFPSAIYLVPIQYSCICVERNGTLDGNSILHNM